MAFEKDLSASNFSIGGQPMENMDSFKYLGIEVDKKLNFNNQTENFAKRCRKSMVF